MPCASASKALRRQAVADRNLIAEEIYDQLGEIDVPSQVEPSFSEIAVGPPPGAFVTDALYGSWSSFNLHRELRYR
jgi:hypothetical protein